MPAFCAQCGTALEPDAKFCEECGARVGEKVISPLQRMNPLVQEIRGRMNKKSTDQLREIYIKHDENRWSKEAFIAIRSILLIERDAFTADLPVYDQEEFPAIAQYEPSPSGGM